MSTPVTLKPEYARTFHPTFGEEVRATIVPGNIDLGASRRKGSDLWEAFATFGKEGLNEPQFATEEAALMHAEKWLLGKLEVAQAGLSNAILKRI